MTDMYLTSDRLTAAGFAAHGFTMRAGGVSNGPFASLNLGFDIGDDDDNVKQNLERLRAAIPVDLPLARVKQVHGTTVVPSEEARLSTWDRRPAVEADAIISSGGDIIAVQTADCAPVLIACPKTRLTAAVHAGWRGAAKGVIRKAVRKMGELGADTSGLIAVIGPTIGFPCYEVGDEVAKAMPESADPAPKRPGKHLLDLPNAVEVSLIVEGLRSDNIDRIGACTHCDTDRFYSYRESGGETGRMLAFISSDER